MLIIILRSQFTISIDRLRHACLFNAKCNWITESRQIRLANVDCRAYDGMSLCWLSHYSYRKTTIAYKRRHSCHIHHMCIGAMACISVKANVIIVTAHP